MAETFYESIIQDLRAVTREPEKPNLKLFLAVCNQLVRTKWEQVMLPADQFLGSRLNDLSRALDNALTPCVIHAPISSQRQLEELKTAYRAAATAIIGAHDLLRPTPATNETEEVPLWM